MNLETLFQTYLKPEEQVIWAGRPRRGLQVRDADLILIPVSIIFLGFSVSMLIMLNGNEDALPFRLFAAFLFLIGVYLGSVRFLLDMRRRSHTCYGITNKRVLMLVLHRKRTLKTLPLKNISRMERIIEKDGSGFIIFGSTNPIYPWLFGNFYFSPEAIPGLILVENVNSVYDLLIGLIRTEISPEILHEIDQLAKDKLN